MDKKMFDGKVAVVTGARTGMGLVTAQKFAELGAAVVLAGRHEPAAEAKELRDRGLKAISVTCDVAKVEDCEKMVEKTVAEFGRLDFAFNNAGIMKDAINIADMTIEDYDETMNINCKGIWACMKYEIIQLVKQGDGGAIVNCSSLGGLVGNPGRSAYHAAKHGVLGMTKSVALEYASQNIRVNAVCPGTIYTPMVERMIEKEKDLIDGYVQAIPAKRMGTSEEIAGAVIWLCSPYSTFVMGQSIAVDGAYTIQ